ncbi:GTP cyclohydrolase N terminal-domain-containing protein [Fomitopsis serialis]|uniref:GTP cyclohydrolase N terminal-domain-containing protein n=1 Tax=Fomitopsis serialis TaxID=139415 RepID=UPI002007F345|nr:GTP cyclohydrolase N terminal-domain-containing protein [Neoantrodia serialis]KAH9936594.1 GTP cyclohydrolase N terminal-domain-containing protein [Neoantrodia serialis]
MSTTQQPVSDAILTQILGRLEALQVSQQALQAKLDALTNPPVSPVSSPPRNGIPIPQAHSREGSLSGITATTISPLNSLTGTQSPPTPALNIDKDKPLGDKERERLLYPGRVLLTTYPDQHGIKPYPLQWGVADPSPILKTEPSFSITPQPGWSDPTKIVSFDPWGHVVPQVFRRELEELGLDIDETTRKGDLVVDGKILIKSLPLRNADGTESTADSGVEIAINKAAVEPVWYLPGVAERFGISESLLRRALFEDTGGMYPELITRPDIKVFLPPIGNLTAYIFGNPAYLHDETKELTLRVHDECNGSDVFGSDICTCKPYLIYAIEECVRCAQRGGVGLVVYFRKEGRALGEVTKYLVYNLRKRGVDSADKYFKATELIAGVKDMRFQALMPDVLHWFGIKKIDNMVSMSDMKYDAIVQSGIPIIKRYDIPEHLLPPDSRVEIDAKIAAGYFSNAKVVTEADLIKTVGRTWEETEH